MHPLALSLILSSTSTVAVSAENCTQPNVAASVTDVLFSGVPSIASSAGEHGITQLRVTLSASPGLPQRVLVERSSGFLALDSLAMQLARKTMFQPEVQGCTAIAGEYFYEVEN